MNQLIVRGFVQRKVRALLTGIAIALGVALMAGTYILTDTINSAFAEVFASAYANKAVVVTEKETLGRHAGAERPVLPRRRSHVSEGSPGVAAAAGSVSTQAALLDGPRERALRAGVLRASSAAASPPASRPSRPPRGVFPTAPDQVAIDQATAQREHLKVGERIVIAGRSPARSTRSRGSRGSRALNPSAARASRSSRSPQAQYIAGEPRPLQRHLRRRSPRASPRPQLALARPHRAAQHAGRPHGRPGSRTTRRRNWKKSSAFCRPSCWCSPSWLCWSARS